MKVIIETYKEVANIITENIPEIDWVDMWHNQINFLEDEYPFPFPAVFLSFRSGTIEDISKGDQRINTFIDVYLAFETLADTYEGSVNQQSALEFGDLLEKLHLTLHATSGENFSNLRRINFTPIDSGGNIMLYRVTYSGEIMDYSISTKRQDQMINIPSPNINTVEGQPENDLEDPIYVIE